MIKNLILTLIALLVFVSRIPHTISIREIIFYLLLLIVIILSFKSYKDIIIFIKTSWLKNIFILLSILTLWIFLYSVLLSTEVKWSAREFGGQWITVLLYFFLGISAAFTTTKQKYFSKELLFTVIFYAMFIHVLFVDLYALRDFIQTKALIRRYGGLTFSPTSANYITNIVLAFIISEIIYRLKTKKKFLFISTYLLYITLFLTLFSSIIEATRNGSTAIVFLGIMTAIFLSYDNKVLTRKIKFLLFPSIIIILSIPIIYNLTHDKRWNTLIQTIPIALDTTHHKAWLDNKLYKYPRLPNGTTVSPSNYERVAWAYEGIKIILTHPLGIGFGRNAFGHVLEMKYGMGRGKHSHSSIIDFTIGVGIPGLLLWLSLIFIIIKKSLSIFKTTENFSSMLIFFTTTGFFTRSIVDSNMRDHMFEEFMFLLGCTLVILTLEEKK